MKKQGFTLVELMISVLITSIVVIAGYALLKGTTSNFNNEDDLVQLRANLRNAEMLIQRDIGRIAFRSNYEARAADGAVDVDMQALRHSRVEFDGRFFSQVTIVGDISDFGFFSIRRASGREILLDDIALTGLQGNDCLQKLAAKDEEVKTLTCGIGHCRDCIDGEPEADAEARFDEAFIQAFQNAAAVHLTSTARNRSVTRRLSNTVRPHNRTLEVAAPLNFNPQDGFAALLIGDRLTPVTAITYTVMRNTARNQELDLVRCTHSLDAQPVIFQCAIVVRNIDYFDIFPIVRGVNRDIVANQMANDRATVGDFSAIANLAWQSDPTYNVQNLTGVNFRMGIHGNRPVVEAQFDAEMNAAQYYSPFFVDGNQVFHRAHVQSSAAIYSVQDPDDWMPGVVPAAIHVATPRQFQIAPGT